MAKQNYKYNGYIINTFWIDETLWIDEMIPSYDDIYLHWLKYRKAPDIVDEINLIAKHLLISEDELKKLPLSLANYFIKELMKMKISQAAIVGKRKELLEYYIEMFNEIPSGSHMVRAYTYMEQIFLDKYSKSEITVDEKQIERFDKLKALALNNQNIHERKLAFTRSIKQFVKIAQMEDLKIPEEEI